MTEYTSKSHVQLALRFACHFWDEWTELQRTKPKNATPGLAAEVDSGLMFEVAARIGDADFRQVLCETVHEAFSIFRMTPGCAIGELIVRSSTWGPHDKWKFENGGLKFTDLRPGATEATRGYAYCAYCSKLP